MRLADFDYLLPPDLIAQHPSARRGESRLLNVPTRGPFSAGPFAEILQYFRGDEVLVVNDTRVVPARVVGQKVSGGAVEILVVEPLGPGRVAAMTRGKALRPGSRMLLPGAEAEIIARRPDGLAEVVLHGVDDLWAWLDHAGAMPLPPYIERAAEPHDADRYQTVFARDPGAVAAPTAGLHFTEGVLQALRDKGVAIHSLTLHVGPGTFLPVRGDDVRDHAMHAERFTVPAETAAAVASGRPVVAVGTTVVRALEAHARDPAADRTDLFILPGFDFRVVDGLLTNFHLPESTLLMLVSAFAGRDRIRRAYLDAVAARLQFYSYGDAMLLRREGGRWT
jgi:S-adenosylmethionine:tRNA ribosyltransferase-isomerase